MMYQNQLCIREDQNASKKHKKTLYFGFMISLSQYYENQTKCVRLVQGEDHYHIIKR
jgi:hypothetical protein